MPGFFNYVVDFSDIRMQFWFLFLSGLLYKQALVFQARYQWLTDGPFVWCKDLNIGKKSSDFQRKSRELWPSWLCTPMAWCQASLGKAVYLIWLLSVSVRQMINCLVSSLWSSFCSCFIGLLFAQIWCNSWSDETASPRHQSWRNLHPSLWSLWLICFFREKQESEALLQGMNLDVARELAELALYSESYFPTLGLIFEQDKC